MSAEVRYEVRHRSRGEGWGPWRTVGEETPPAPWVRDALALVFDRRVGVGDSSGITEWRKVVPEPAQPTRPASLSFAELHEANLARCRRWHAGFPDDEAWTGADWSNAVAGEGGELIEAAALVAAATGKVANTVKKVRRYETGTNTAVDKPLDALWAELDAEMADVACYLDLLATKYGRDLAGAIVAKFNAVSERQGFPERLGAEGTRAVCRMHERALVQCDCWCTCGCAVRGAHGAECRQGVAPIIRRKQASA